MAAVKPPLKMIAFGEAKSQLFSFSPSSTPEAALTGGV